MGSQRAREITRQIERLRDIENRTNYEFKRLKESIRFQGASDFEMKKATIFKENLLNALKTLPETYKPVYEYLKSIQNPIEFYNISQNSQMLSEIFSWYEQPSMFGNFKSNDEIVEFIFNELKGR